MKAMQRHLEIVLVTAALLVGMALPSATWSQPQGGPIAELQQQVSDLEADVANLQSQTAVSVPIGTVLDWWCTTVCALPAGFAIADGSLVTDAASPFNGQNLPNLLNRFVRGVTVVGAIGTQGGTLNHTHIGSASNTGAHSHTAGIGSAGSHTHTTSSTGSHSHGNTGGPIGTRSVLGGFSSAASTTHTHNTFSAGTHSHNTFSAGDHTHSVSVGIAGSHGHVITINTVGHTPSFFGLLKIIRIK